MAHSSAVPGSNMDARRREALGADGDWDALEERLASRKSAERKDWRSRLEATLSWRGLFCRCCDKHPPFTKQPAL